MIDKLIELFRNHDTVTFVVTGVGETTCKTIEFKEAIEALEKQTPEKPKQHFGEYDGESWPVCPKCSLELMPNGEKYCSDCGQAIEWEETE